MCFALLVAGALAAFWTPLATLLAFSFEQPHYSHIVLIPFISATLILVEKKRIFAHLQAGWLAGFGLAGTGLVVFRLGQRPTGAISLNDQLSITMSGVVLVVVGGFVLCYGRRAGRSALFPLVFLVLMVPIPDFLLNRAITALQLGSAEVSYVLFALVGVPVLRTGSIFALPGVTIEIAEECSGIRSSLALMITSLLIGHLMLRSTWAKCALVLATLPLLIIKNGIRIVSLSLLSIYVDPRFLHGHLHDHSGIVFFSLALMCLALFLRLLQKSERRLRAAPVGGWSRLSGGASLNPTMARRPGRAIFWWRRRRTVALTRRDSAARPALIHLSPAIHKTKIARRHAARQTRKLLNTGKSRSPTRALRDAVC